MKKILSLLLVCAIALSFGACALMNQGGESSESALPSETSSQVPEESSQLEATPSDPPQTSSESGESSSEGDKVVAAQVKGEGESGNLPGIEGSAEFVEKFEGNAIDSYYLDAISKASSVAEMVDVTNKVSQSWEAQMNTTYDQLLQAVSSDAAESDRIQSEQTAWNNDINITIQEIKDAASEGSMANVEISYGILLMYRGRCVTLLSELYNYSGEVTVTMSSSEAVG